MKNSLDFLNSKSNPFQEVAIPLYYFLHLIQTNIN